MKKTGIWLIQLGTPDAPTPSAVRKYLREFLGDPRVIDIPFIFRWPLVNLIIAPFRAKNSAHAYQSIWTREGSPLRVNTENLVAGLKTNLSDAFSIKYSMTYGAPSFVETYNAFKQEGVEQIIVFPLFPQYASATVGAVTDQILKFKDSGLTIAPPFYREDFFIRALERNIHRVAQNEKIDHWVFSFHSLPVRQILKSDPTHSYCLKDGKMDCCKVETEANSLCYRAQCYRTTIALRERLGWSEKNSSMSFQSKLGRAKWLTPSTTEVLAELGAHGIKKVGVVCPSFVSDCLETLEEIAIREKENFKRSGGENLFLVPAPNSDSEFVSDFSKFLNSRDSSLGRCVGDNR